MQYRPTQLRTKNTHGILTMFMFALEIEKLVLSYNKRHQISCATGSSIVTRDWPVYMVSHHHRTSRTETEQ